MIFLTKADVLKVHRRALEEFGGGEGLRDEGALESALQAAENRYFYENADLAVCAATYAFHLSKAHAFLDGNKRVAAVSAEVFLIINGARLDARSDELEEFYLNIAAGKIVREEAEMFFRKRIHFKT
jgi:death-on-curing protein